MVFFLFLVLGGRAFGGVVGFVVGGGGVEYSCCRIVFYFVLGCFFGFFYRGYLGCIENFFGELV